MISFLIFLIFLGIAGFGLLMIGGLIYAIYKHLTAPRIESAEQVRRVLLACYRADDYLRAARTYALLPNWSVSAKLRQTAAVHHAHHGSLRELANFFSASGMDLNERVRESQALLTEYAELAGQIVGVSHTVDGKWGLLPPATQRTFNVRAAELDDRTTFYLRLKPEIQNAYLRKDRYAAMAISEQLDHHFSQLRGANKG